jgi:hypothetical protein
MNKTARRAFEEQLEMYRYAEKVLGSKAWHLLVGYGRVMTGPYVGQYVSGLPTEVTRELVELLVDGKELHVHLMHRHVSGIYESSRTRYDGSKLWMLFADRSELA